MHWLEAHKKKASSLAILNSLGILYPPIDIVSIITTMGIEIFWVDGADWDSAAESDIQGHAKIYCNVKNASAEKCRFEVARCFALLLQNDLNITFRNVSQSTSLRDIRANLYALELLVPWPQVQVLISSGICNVEKLAQSFQVTPSLMELRLKQLKYNLR